MAFFTGKAAQLKMSLSQTDAIGAATTTVGQLESIQINQSQELVEITQLGSDVKTKQPSFKDYTVDINGHLDYKDTGIKLLTIGALVDFEISPEHHTTVGQMKVKGKAYINDVSFSTSAGDTTKFSASLSGVVALQFSAN